MASQTIDLSGIRELTTAEIEAIAGGWSLQEVDISNTSNTAIGVFAPLPSDSSLTHPYIDIKAINGVGINLESQFGPK